MLDFLLESEHPTAELDFALTAAPKVGRSLGARVTALNPPIRGAIAELSSCLPHRQLQELLTNSTCLGPGGVEDSISVRAAWLLVACSLLHARATHSLRIAPLKTCVGWFTGDPVLACNLQLHYGNRWSAAERELSSVSCDKEFWTLLPYILEPDGHITRSDFENCTDSKARKARKRTDGVFYTPGDVADFMANTLFRPDCTWLDPACGTGVFLKAVLNAIRQRQKEIVNDLDFVRKNLFAIDKSALATDLAAIVLTEQFITRKLKTAPITLWKEVKANIVCADAQRIHPSTQQSTDLFIQPDKNDLQSLFGTRCAHGFDLIILNPPYAKTAITNSECTHWDSLPKGAGQIDAHILFTEMMWKFTNTNGAAIAVLPLSVGANTSTSYALLRSGMSKIGGQRTFLFFDREPQGLFGEDIKTRNTILYIDKSSQKSRTYTSGLVKWSANQRSFILNLDRAVSLGSIDISEFVPKISSPTEQCVYSALREQRKTNHLDACRLTLAEIYDQPSEKSVYISATAYNFVNVFCPDGLPTTERSPLSNSPIHKLTFPNKDLSFAAFSVLSSRLMFWLWHVECDGFHVSSDFIKRSPLWSILKNEALVGPLAAKGRAHWNEIKQFGLRSVNGGKVTYSFHAGYDTCFYNEIDCLILEGLGIQQSTSFLDQFIANTVHVGGVRRDRTTYKQHQ